MGTFSNFLKVIKEAAKSFFTLEKWVSSDKRYGEIDEELRNDGK